MRGTAEKFANLLGKSSGTVFPVFLNVRNLHRTHDIFSRYQQLEDTLRTLKNKDIITDAQYNSLIDRAVRADNKNVKDERDWGKLRDVVSFWEKLNGILQKKRGLGIVYVNEVEGGGDSYAVFKPEQIKSATGNSGAFNPADANIYHSTAPQAYTRDLIATHNISAAGILHADKLGGLPWASFAVTRANQPLTGFGDVTLIGDRGLADPQGRKKAKVFGADIYSPRQPRPVYKIGRDAIDKMWAPFARLAERFKEDTKRDLDSYAHDTDAVRADDIRHTLSRSPVVRYTFLAQRGEAPSLHELDGTARDTEERLRQTIEANGAENDFNDYVDDLWESLGGEPRLFKGYTEMGNRRFGRYDLAGIAAVMKRNLRGGESGSYGTGQVRAHVTPQFKTLKAIRSGRVRLTDGETFRRLRDEVDNEAAKIGDTLGIHDETEFLQQVATDGWAKAVEGRAALDTPQNRRMVEDFLAKLADMPTEYFEGKLPGIARFSDFTAAVVPHDLGARAREVLENAGLRLFTYGDGESRSRAIEAAARVLDAERGGDILFSTTPEQQRTLRLASNRILNIARTIQNGGKYISGAAIDFGATPPVYQALGAEALPLKILNPRKLFSLLRPKSEQGQRGDNTHELTPELLAQVPQALQEPTLVFDSEQLGALVAVTELTDGRGNPVIVPIHLAQTNAANRVNKIASVYGKDDAAAVFADWQKKGRLRYVDTRKPSLLRPDGVQFSQGSQQGLMEHTVLTEADVVKLQQQLAQTEAETQTGQALFSTAWHGTPYRGIEKEGFKLHRIGTGEGAQSYGWGIYFAEEKAVAEGYRARLSDDYTDALVKELHVSSDYTVDDLEYAWEEYLNDLSPAAQDFMRKLRANDWLGFDSAWDAITAGLNLALYKKRYGNELTDGIEAAAERFQQESGVRNAGQVYKVDVPEKNDLLRYDGKEQSAKVQKILEDNHLLPRLDDYRANYDAETGTWQVKYYGEAPGIENRESVDAQRARSARSVREEAWLADQKKGKDIYRALIRQYGSPKMASIALNSMGIPGLYYADGFSRGKKGGTSNFVIWDDALLTPDAAHIEAQYSVPPQLVTDPPSVAGLGKRIMQAFADPTIRDLWFDRQGELDRILRADPKAEKVRNAFKMYNARVQHVLEGVPQTMIQDLGKALAAHFQEAEKRIPALQNMKANKKVREQMFMEWLDGVGKYIYHGRERNAVILQRSKGKQADGSGTDEAGIQEAERFFNSAEMGGGVLLTMYEDLYTHHLQPMMQMSDDYLRESGLLTPEMEAARPNYRWYVPLFGAPQMEDSTIEKIVKDAAAAQRPNNGGASRTDVIRNRTHNAEGRHGTEAHNLFENIIAQMETAVRRAELQEPKRKLWAYLQTAEGTRLFNATTSEYTINGGNRNTQGGRSWQKHTPDADEVVWQDSDTIHRMHIGNLRALEAIRDFNRQAFKYGANPLIDAGSWGLEQAGRMTRFMAGMYTRYNPSFVLRNKAMDSIQQWITLLADAPVGKETRAGVAGLRTPSATSPAVCPLPRKQRPTTLPGQPAAYGAGKARTLRRGWNATRHKAARPLTANTLAATNCKACKTSCGRKRRA